MQVSTIGLDIAKNVFQVHGVDTDERVAMQRRLRRREVLPFFAKLPPTLIGIEACGSAHYWARELSALGHEVRLMPPAYVTPYRKRNKTDARDAEAICEAVRRPNMRFVPIKTVEQQAARGLHRVRDLLVRQCTQIANAVRGLSAEFGLVTREGRDGLGQLFAAIESQPAPIPEPLCSALIGLARQWEALNARIRELDERIVRESRAHPTACRLMEVPGIGPITAHALVAGVADPGVFASARDFAAWLGLTPRENSSANKRVSGAISRAGDGTLRRLLVLGAASLVRQSRARPQRTGPWLLGLLARRPVKVAIVAQAAKSARIAWALMATGEHYRAKPAAA
jgi:transposase